MTKIVLNPVAENGLQLLNDNYTLPTASASVLGGIKVGSRLSINTGVLSADVQTTDITGKASLALDNLASVAINTSLISDTDSTYDLGSSSKYWSNAYIDKIFLNATATLDGSVGGLVSVVGNLGIKNTASDASFGVQGSATKTATGTVSSTGGTVNGSGTLFSSEMIVGTVLWKGADSRIITWVSSDTLLYIDAGFPADFSAGSTLYYNEPILLGYNSTGTSAFMVDARGYLGLGTLTAPSGNLAIIDANTPKFRIQDTTNYVTFDFSVDDYAAFLDFQNMADAAHFRVDGNKLISIASSSKIGFFGVTPVVRQAYTAVSNPPTQAEVTAIRYALVNLGLMAAS